MLEEIKFQDGTPKPVRRDIGISEISRTSRR